MLGKVLRTMNSKTTCSLKINLFTVTTYSAYLSVISYNHNKNIFFFKIILL